jgi:hypothetical protein
MGTSPQPVQREVGVKYQTGLLLCPACTRPVLFPEGEEKEEEEVKHEAQTNTRGKLPVSLIGTCSHTERSKKSRGVVRRSPVSIFSESVAVRSQQQNPWNHIVCVHMEKPRTNVHACMEMETRLLLLLLLLAPRSWATRPLSTNLQLQSTREIHIERRRAKPGNENPWKARLARLARLSCISTLYHQFGHAGSCFIYCNY